MLLLLRATAGSFPMLSANVDDALPSVGAPHTNSIASDGLKTTSFSTTDSLLS